jgi:hypothetical protein
MRVRNKKSYMLGLSYAGPKKGYMLRPGGLSPELPADRFYHPQLQLDWKRGMIDVLLSEMDRAALGSAVAMFKTDNQVQVKDDEVRPVREAPKPTTPTKQTIVAAMESKLAVAPAATSEKLAEPEEVPPEGEPVEPYASSGDDAAGPDPDGVEPVEDGAEGPELCQQPTCKHADVKVQYDERVDFFLCQYCRQQVTRRYKKISKDMPDAADMAIYQKISTDMNLGYAPQPADEPEPGAEIIDDDDAPEQFGYGLSLSDLNKQ